MLRKLSPSERMDLLLAAEFANVFAVTGRVAGRCSAAELGTAIQAVTSRHPQLRVRVARRAGDPRVRLSSVGVPAPPLRIARPGTRWEAAVAAELQQPFPFDRGPLTRFVLIPDGDGFDLLIVTSHLIADGRALVYLLRDILERVAGLDAPSGVLIPPSPWQLADIRPDPAPRPPAPRPPAERPAGNRGQHRPAGPFEVIAATLDEQRTAALVARCRQESTTVHAALSIAFGRGLADAIPGARSRLLGCPFSLRELLPPEAAGAFGSYQGPPAQLTVETGAPTDFWADAREFKAELNRQSSPASVRLASRYLRALTLLPDPLARRMLCRLIADDPDLWISNLGELPVPDSLRRPGTDRGAAGGQHRTAGPPSAGGLGGRWPDPAHHRLRGPPRDGMPDRPCDRSAGSGATASPTGALIGTDVHADHRDRVAEVVVTALVRHRHAGMQCRRAGGQLEVPGQRR